MHKAVSDKPVHEIVAAINALDLDPIKVKLMDHEEGQGWTREYVDQMEIAYKRFLTLLVKYPQQTIAPTKDVDKFWHGHILDTLKYAEDCASVFGYFLHHFPYLGMRGADDAAVLAAAGNAMATLYQKEFGEVIPTRAAYCGVAAEADAEAAYCGATVNADSAYCGAAVKADNAYCGAAVKADSAYCGAAVKTDAAYCGAAVKTDAAYCGAAVKADAAYCGAAVKADNAYCGAAVKASNAYCGAAGDKLKTSVRPKLPAIA